MIVEDQKVFIKWSSNNKKYYESLGYKYTKIGDEFEINVFHLTKGSHKEVICKCDYCGVEIKKPYKLANKSDKIACKKCIPLKQKDTLMEKYGVTNVMQIESVKEKVRQTCIEKYGCSNPLQNEIIKNKVKETNLKKYGTTCTLTNSKIKEKSRQTMINRYNVEHPLKSEEIKNKVKKTMIKKYGVECSFQSEEVKQKIKKSNMKKYGAPSNMQSKIGYEEYKNSIIKKYGVDNIAKVESVKENIRKSLYKNNTAPCSKQQRYLCELLNGELNYPVSYFSLDIAFLNDKLYIEYDGSGHDLRVKKGYITEKQFNREEVSRKKYLQNQGWKIIRIISKYDKMYNDDLIIELFNKAKKYLLSTEHSWVEIDIDNNEYRCALYVKQII